MNTWVARYLLDVLPETADALPEGVRPAALLRLVGECLGEELARFPDGRMLIWNIARHDGYNIPPYPMAGCGDVKEFLADEGARNVPDWYERHLGYPRELYDRIYEYELVMVRNRRWWRKVFLVGAATIEGGDGRAVSELLAQIRQWVSFALGSQGPSEDDPWLFTR